MVKITPPYVFFTRQKNPSPVKFPILPRPNPTVSWFGQCNTLQASRSFKPRQFRLHYIRIFVLTMLSYMKGKMIKISGPNYFFFQLIQNVGRSGNLQRNPSRFSLLISTVSCQNQTEVIANCNTRIFSNAWDMCYHCCFNKMARKQFPIYCESVCSYHVTYAFQSESTLYSCLNVKELLARSRREI